MALEARREAARSKGSKGLSQFNCRTKAFSLYTLQKIRRSPDKVPRRSAYARSKKFAEAQIKFQEALSGNPNFAEAHNNLGYSLRKQGPQNYAQALEHYNQAIQLKPNLAEAYEYRGVLFVKMGRKAEAEKDVATLKTLNPKLATELGNVIETGHEE